MKINVYSIAKKEKENIVDSIITQSKQFGAELSDICIWNNNISDAQKRGEKEAKTSYSKSLLQYIGVHNIILHPAGKLLDSFRFSELIRDKNEVNFFIGGAFGFEESFFKNNFVLSLSPLTFSHNICKIILFEQIYRGLSIINNHPYHK